MGKVSLEIIPRIVAWERRLVRDVRVTVPIYYLAKPLPRERAWENQRGKKTLLSLTLVWYCKVT